MPPQQSIEDQSVNPLLAALLPLPLADSLLYPGAILLVERCPRVLRQVRKLLEAAVVQQVEGGACAAVRPGYWTESRSCCMLLLSIITLAVLVQPRQSTGTPVWQHCSERPALDHQSNRIGGHSWSATDRNRQTGQSTCNLQDPSAAHPGWRPSWGRTAARW